MDKSPRRDFILGLVFFGAIGLLLYYTILLTGFSFDQKTSYHVWFEEAAGLKAGDAVFVAGRQTGSVMKIDFHDQNSREQRIGVTLNMDESVTLHEGYQIMISEFTMLGGRVVEIDPGPFGAGNLPPNTQLFGDVQGAALAAIGTFLDENRGNVEAILSNLRTTTDDLASGEGLLGALLSDSKMKEDASDTLASLQQVTADIKNGTGVLGLLVTDEEQRNRVVDMLKDTDAFLRATKTIVEDLEQGRGTLGAMLKDEMMQAQALSLAEDLAWTASRVRIMIDGAENGDGILGRVIAREDLAEEAEQLIHDLAQLTRQVAKGEGTVGKLLQEQEAYNELLQALQSLNGQLEDAREAQPVSSFAQMLFGGF